MPSPCCSQQWCIGRPKRQPTWSWALEPHSSCYLSAWRRVRSWPRLVAHRKLSSWLLPSPQMENPSPTSAACAWWSAQWAPPDLVLYSLEPPQGPMFSGSIGWLVSRGPWLGRWGRDLSIKAVALVTCFISKYRCQCTYHNSWFYRCQHLWGRFRQGLVLLWKIYQWFLQY